MNFMLFILAIVMVGVFGGCVFYILRLEKENDTLRKLLSEQRVETSIQRDKVTELRQNGAI